MKPYQFMAASALALVLSMPAYAATTAATDKAGDEVSSSSTQSTGVVDSVKNGLTKADTKMRTGADDIRAFIIGKDSTPGAKLEPVLIHRSQTAHGLIGETVVDTQGKKVAALKDIIIDKDGKASMVVVSDGGLLGIGGKVAAFDYDKVVKQNPDGTVVMTLSQDMIDHAKDFSYDQKDWAKAKIIPAGSVSVNALLDGNVVDNNGKKVADVENVYFRDADVSQVIVGFNKKLGMGGDLAALDYDALQMVKKNKDVDFKLTSNQAAQFKSFKQSVAN